MQFEIFCSCYHFRPIKNLTIAYKKEKMEVLAECSAQLSDSSTELQNGKEKGQMDVVSDSDTQTSSQKSSELAGIVKVPGSVGTTSSSSSYPRKKRPFSDIVIVCSLNNVPNGYTAVRY